MLDDTNMPAVVLTVTVVLLVLAIGTFAFFIVNSEIGYTKTQEESYDVSDPTVAQQCNTQYYIESVTQVEQYNGIAWVTVDPAFWSQTTSKQVTVQPGGMQG
jgi:hypothetical protein